MTDTLTSHDVEEGKLPEGWEVRELCELVDVLDSRRKPVNAKERADRPGDVPYYGATGQVGTIDEALFDEDLVLLGEDGVQFFDPDKQKAYEISGPAWVNNHAHVLRCNQDLYQQSLLIHFLNQADYRNRANGTTRLKLTQAAMKEIPVLTPPMDEQERIVEILEDQLSRLDTALQSVHTVRKKAAQFRRSLLHAAFTGALSGHDVEEGELPEGWELRPLSDLAEVQLGRSRSPKNHTGPSMRPYLRAANVTWGGLDLSDITEMNFTDKEMEVYRLRAGDILVNEASGSASQVGKAAIFGGEIEDCGFQNHLIRVRVHSVDNKFLHLHLVHNALSGVYTAESRGIGINHLGKAKLAAWPIATPPPEEQERIVEILEEQLSRLDASLAVADAVEEHSAALRRSLLHSAFTGRLTREWREAVNV
jgi:type I restriction enzyme S subunit